MKMVFKLINIYSKILSKVGNICKVPFLFYKVKNNIIISSLIDILDEADSKVKTYESYEESEFHIWIMWWQGYDTAPKIVKSNYKRLKKYLVIK